MGLWQRTPDIDALNTTLKNSIGEVLDIRFEAFDDESLSASMVIDSRTHQPYGLLHGGASVVLAETLGSTASYLCIDSSKFYCVGLEVNANHLRGKTDGTVTGASSNIMYPSCCQSITPVPPAIGPVHMKPPSVSRSTARAPGPVRTLYTTFFSMIGRPSRMREPSPAGARHLRPIVHADQSCCGQLPSSGSRIDWP